MGCCGAGGGACLAWRAATRLGCLGGGPQEARGEMQQWEEWKGGAAWEEGGCSARAGNHAPGVGGKGGGSRQKGRCTLCLWWVRGEKAMGSKLHLLGGRRVRPSEILLLTYLCAPCAAAPRAILGADPLHCLPQQPCAQWWSGCAAVKKGRKAGFGSRGVGGADTPQRGG